ncbi:SCO3374 family protein [Streptomyces sp. NPDC001135]
MVGSVPALSTVPFPRRPLDPGAPDAGDLPACPDARARHWYENDLGWATVPGRPLRLLTGVRFDVLDVPAEAGAGALRHLAPGSPVALRGDRMELLLAAGSAEELPGLLDWLEWGAVALDLRVLGAGGATEAPAPPAGVAAGLRAPAGVAAGLRAPAGVAAGRGGLAGVAARVVPPVTVLDGAAPTGAGSMQGAAVWLRPPGPGGEVEASLPAMPALGREGSAPDLVRLVDTVAAHCHRVRLRRVRAGLPTACRRDQPLAFS